ncbi:hypothetical protein O6H91_13G068200 [Diphasiastrum complanatum]|uniref:Uncharacterized protein n=1 Tax=Diphasiastrum complanatum TaxID=34168 RepID=A0ACC2BVU3_DIPCM|nr:hypothetical protein O6H91_13G068200 [Diphasiastrum complanatum]
MLSRMIWAKPSVPHQIILTEFAVPPIQLSAIFQLILYIQRVMLLSTDEQRYIQMALASSRHLYDQGHRLSWFSQASQLLDTLGISITDLPSGTHEYIRRFLYRGYLRRTWQGQLEVKPDYYRTHFLELDTAGLPVLPHYPTSGLSHGLRFLLGQFRVSSHQLAIETGRFQCTPREERICQLCSLAMVESEEHFLFTCPVYYEIRGRYHCLFRQTHVTLRSLISYEDPRCVALMLREMSLLRQDLCQAVQHTYPVTQSQITSFFSRRRSRSDVDMTDSDCDDIPRPRTQRRRTTQPQATMRVTRPTRPPRQRHTTYAHTHRRRQHVPALTDVTARITSFYSISTALTS